MKSTMMAGVLALVLSTSASAALVVEYTFDGDALDTSGNGEHLTLSNGATFGPGYDGQALVLDGIDDFASVAIGNYGLTTFTVEAWVNVPNFSRNLHYVSLYQDNYIVLGDYGSNNGPINTWASGLNPVDVGPVIADPSSDEWHHLAFSFDGTDQVVYLDGVIVNDVPTTGTLGGGFVGNLTIGARYTQATQFMLGSIDNVRIHDTAVPQDELGFFTDAATPPPPPAPPAAPYVAVPVPTLSTWGLGFLVLLMGLAGLSIRRSH